MVMPKEMKVAKDIKICKLEALWRNIKGKI
jgi:hypothetical protein